MEQQALWRESQKPVQGKLPIGVATYEQWKQERYFPPGRRDLNAAFILRCIELAADGGRGAMVTQQSWMFLRSFADLRPLDDKKQTRAPLAFRGVLREASIETLAHLGPRAFTVPAQRRTQETAEAGARWLRRERHGT